MDDVVFPVVIIGLLIYCYGELRAHLIDLKAEVDKLPKKKKGRK